MTLNAPGAVQTLAGQNTNSGLTTVTAGTLALGPSGGLGSGGLTLVPGTVLDVSAYGSLGYSFTGGVLTAGRTASFATDVNGTLNLQNATLNVAGAPSGSGNAGTLTLSGGFGLGGGTLNYVAGDQIAAQGGPLTFSGTLVFNTAAKARTARLSSRTRRKRCPNPHALHSWARHCRDLGQFICLSAAGSETNREANGLSRATRQRRENPGLPFAFNRSSKLDAARGLTAVVYFVEEGGEH